MSFVDLATLAMARRSELEGRIDVLLEKCSCAVTNIKKIENHVGTFVAGLNCEPSELKNRFLNYMKCLDELIYLVTDFNLSVDNFGILDSPENTPVLDKTKEDLSPKHPVSLLDVLSEPLQPSNVACINKTPMTIKKETKVRTPKEDWLIYLSSASVSEESVNTSRNNYVADVRQPDNCSAEANNVPSIALVEEATGFENYNLPAQDMLEIDKRYSAIIIHSDGPMLWVITDDVEELNYLKISMQEYYDNIKMTVSREDVMSMSYCTYYDEETDAWYRCFKLNEMENDTVELYCVDTGETRIEKMSSVKPLMKQFCDKPPFARCCHLAELEFTDESVAGMGKVNMLMHKYIGAFCDIYVEDNSSESLGVIVLLDNRLVLNNMLIEQGLAQPIAGSNAASLSAVNLPPPPPTPSPPADDFGYDDCPEYDDALEAVTGYHNRDEADICKFYKGGPEKTCWKGSKCKKKHIRKHPDGWTMDKIEVMGNSKPMPLPKPGTWIDVRVTAVAYFDRVYLQIITKREPESMPPFGVLLPPTTLQGLVRDMNTPAARVAYKPLKIAPAPGEIVAARYPPDSLWYRARVLSVTRSDGDVQIMYVDYGNEFWVKETDIMAMDLIFMALPFQAIRCKLAGVNAVSNDPKKWKEAMQALSDLVINKETKARVISRQYDEMDVELVDGGGYSVSQLLAAKNLVRLTPVEDEDDSATNCKFVVP